jgi:cold shock CspA family protein
VKFFKSDKGYGTIAAADLPDGLDARVHFSVIEMDGYRVCVPKTVSQPLTCSVLD